MCELQILIE